MLVRSGAHIGDAGRLQRFDLLVLDGRDSMPTRALPLIKAGTAVPEPCELAANWSQG